MHSTQSPYDANGWNSMQNGHYRQPQQQQQQQMPYHYQQNRHQMRLPQKPTQINTRHHHRPPIHHSNPHPMNNVNHQYNGNHQKRYSAPQSDDNAPYLQHYRSPTTETPSSLRYSNPNPNTIHQMPQISEPIPDQHNIKTQQRYNRSNTFQQSNNHQRARTHNTSFLRTNAMHEAPATMHSMHKFKSNDSSNHSIYSPESIRSQPPPQREPTQINNMKKNKSFNLYDEPQQKKTSRSRTLSGRTLNHNHQYTQSVPIPNINEIRVFSPKEMNIPNNIGLTDYKQSEYIEQDYYDKIQPRSRRADTAPHYNNNMNQRSYAQGFITSVDENMEYGFDGRQRRQHPPSAHYIGSPIYSNQFGSPIYSNQHQYMPYMNNNQYPHQYMRYNESVSSSDSDSDSTEGSHSSDESESESVSTDDSMTQSSSQSQTDSMNSPSKSLTKKKKKKKKKRKGKDYAKRKKKSNTKKKRTSYDIVDNQTRYSITELSDDNSLRDDDNDTPSHLCLIQNKVYSKSKKTAILVRSTLKRQMLFVGLEDAMLDEMVDKMYGIKCSQNECIMKQNEIGNALFVIECGKFIIIRNDGVIGTATAKSMVGEGALLYSKPRRATFKAKEDSMVWALDIEEFMKIRLKLTRKNHKKCEKKIKFLSSIPLFCDLDIMDIMDIALAIRPILYRRGANIITQNEESTHFFIVYKGKCESYQNKKRICKYEHAMYFGDKGIITNGCSQYTVIATSDDVICYVLNGVEFMKFFAPNITKIKYKKLNIKNVNNNNNILLDSFSHIGVIGVGSFGEISLVLNRNTNKTYALKKIRKNIVISTHSQHHIKNERTILCTLNNIFCIKLYSTFVDELNVYLLLEPVLGGELYYLLKFNKRFPEKTARFYAANVVLAFEYIHSKNIIFRDLKPQNLLVSNNGYIKLIDFGFSKIRNDSCTLCGTPSYLAPETIQCSHQSFTTDWWTLGIFIFEMIVGTAPFRDDLSVKMYEKILSSSVNFPSKIKISRTGKDLITSLLRKHPYKRLGSGLYGAKQIKKHQWFQSGFNWNKFEKQQIQPPYIPSIANNCDISNFEKFKKKNIVETLINDPNGDLYSWCQQF